MKDLITAAEAALVQLKFHHDTADVIHGECPGSPLIQERDELELALKRERAELDDELVHDFLGKVSHESIRARIRAIDRARE